MGRRLDDNLRVHIFEARISCSIFRLSADAEVVLGVGGVGGVAGRWLAVGD